VEADAVSRFPCLGPIELAPDGVKEAFNILLAALPQQWETPGRIWVYAQKETEIIQQMVRHWISLLPKTAVKRKVPYVESTTKDRIKNVDYGLGMWVPTADKVKDIVNAAFERNKPFACLVPSCLIHHIPKDPRTRVLMNRTKKLVLLQPEVTWIIHRIPSITNHEVYTIQEDINTFGNDQEGSLPNLGGIIRGSPRWNLKEWVPDQEKMVTQFPKIYPKRKIWKRKTDGFLLFKPDEETTLALVPTDKREELTVRQHHDLCHAGYNKVYRALVKHWHWPTMKKDIRSIVTNCAPCQLLKAKRMRAHRHFRAKVFCTPRTIWGCDFYGVAKSKRGYCNILGAIDLATAEIRLFACRKRTAPVVTDCILHGIVLRDGCPLHIHTDAAKEFISKAMNRLCTLLGCRQTTTLAHHPTGNAAIERLWQWCASCIRQMTNEQHQEWENYVRLMEHVWNTSYHSVLQCTPFEAAHGLPARSALDTLVQQDHSPTDARLMTKDDLSAMRDTAKAFEEQIGFLRLEAARRNAQQNRRGTLRKFKVGDRVCFYIPPSEREAQNMGRKPKHMLQYKGPAIVKEVLSNTTYKIKFEDRIYYRCLSELRLYKSTRLPVDLPIANDVRMQEDKLIIGNFVSLCETNDENDDRFHLCKVMAIEDDKAVLLNYGTWTPNIKSAVFKIMYQETNTGRYTTQTPTKNAKSQQVIDRIELQEADDYIDHYDIKMRKSMKISAKSARQLRKLGLKHHILGKTFP